MSFSGQSFNYRAAEGKARRDWMGDKETSRFMRGSVGTPIVDGPAL